MREVGESQGHGGSGGPEPVKPSSGMSADSLRRALIHVMGALGILAIPVQLLWLGLVFQDPFITEVDARQIWFQAERIRGGEPLYGPSASSRPYFAAAGPAVAVEDSPYPPLVGSVVALFPATSLLGFDRAWYLIMLPVFWAYAGTLAWMWTGRWGLWSSAVAHGSLLLTPGAWDGYAEGNIDPALWLLFALSLALPRFRGAGMALWAGVKVHAVWPLAFACLRERGIVIWPASLAVLLSALVCAIALGPGRFVNAAADWLEYVPGVRSQGFFRASNVSLSFFVLRLWRWAGWEYGGGPLPLLARAWLLLATFAAPISAGYLTRNWREASQYGAVMIAAILFAPLCWLSYLPIVLAPIAASQMEGACGEVTRAPRKPHSPSRG